MEDNELGTIEAVKPSVPALSPLAERLRRQLKTEPGQIVRITQIGKSNFRINWYTAISGEDGIKLAHYRISKSSFVAVRDLGDSLEILDRTIVQPSLN